MTTAAHLAAPARPHAEAPPTTPRQRSRWWLAPAVIGGALIWTLAAAACFGAAAAEVRCAPYGLVQDDLMASGERSVFVGLDGRGMAVEVWLSPAGTWTWLAISSSGQACLVAAGQAGGLVKPKKDGEGEG